MLCQLALCEIEFRAAGGSEQLLAGLDRVFSRVQHDIRLGLRCKFRNSTESYSDALDLCNRMTNKASFFHKKLRLDALTGELRVSALKDSVRQSYEAEVSTLAEELKSSTVASRARRARRFWPR